MAPFGISTRTNKRQGTYAHQIQSRVGGYHRGLNTLTRLSPSNSTIGSGAYSIGSTGTRASTANSSIRNNVPRNVPKPLQTSSLKKENGGQDITAVLVNRRDGKKILKRLNLDSFERPTLAGSA